MQNTLQGCGCFDLFFLCWSAVKKEVLVSKWGSLIWYYLSDIHYWWGAWRLSQYTVLKSNGLHKNHIFKTVGLTSHSEQAFMLEILYFAFHFFFYLLSLLFLLEAVKVVGALQAYPCTQTANLHLLSISRLLGISISQVGTHCLAFDLRLLAPVYSLLNVIFFFH